MQVQSLGLVDSLQKEKATLSSILAWEIPCAEEPWVLQFMESQKSWTQLVNKQKQQKELHDRYLEAYF